MPIILGCMAILPERSGIFGFHYLHLWENMHNVDRYRTLTYMEANVGKKSTAERVARSRPTPPDTHPRLRDLSTLTADRSVDDIFDITSGRAMDETAEIGPYNAVALAGRALDLGAGLSMDYLDGFVYGLKDLHNLTALDEPTKKRRR